MLSEASCSGFEPQTYLHERCKKCFCLKSKHGIVEEMATTNDDLASSFTSNSARDRNREKRRSWKDKMNVRQDNGAPEHVGDVNDDDTTSCTSYKSASSKGLSSSKSTDSIASNQDQDSRSMITAISESLVDDDRAATPMEGDSLHDTSIMKAEIARLNEEVAKLKEERQNWTVRRDKKEKKEDETLIEMFEERLAEAESCIQDYRDENTVLKCELRDLQEGLGIGTDAESKKLVERLKASESLCDELMEENEALKADVKDLQQEIEEMQDQYREEEIEEFRELQRELEQNAKNCRILQFKLRKSERARDQLDSEKEHLETKVKDLLEASSSGMVPNGKQMDAMRIKELESELRIAKEVSVRLHNELENAEEKRYKLEDEVFYLKDKVRELQTQNKWREARNRTELQKRANLDISAQVTDMNVGKEMRDILEREADLRDQLKFAEEDLRRTQIRLQDVENENEELLRKLSRMRTVKRPPMTRSFSEGHAQIQLELAEHEMEHLSTKVERLEQKNIHLSKKIMEMESDSKKLYEDEDERKLQGTTFQVAPEIERDMSKLMATISELERKNLDLTVQLKRQVELGPPLAHEKSQTELRIEKEHKKIIENELMELKKMMLQSDNQKLISMATKVELLNNQLALVNDRCLNLHRKVIKEGSNDATYMDALKSRCEELERQLSEQKAKSTLLNLQGESATTDEIEQCCEVLASVETQTNRICKQIERIDSSQKDERRRSLSKDGSATIIAELASVMSELNNVHQLLEAHKVNITNVARRSPIKTVSNLDEPRLCTDCVEKEAFIDSQRDEILFYKKKNKELTNQVLQTEDRWTVEIEKQRQIYEGELKTIREKLANVEKHAAEQEQLLESRAVALTEKASIIQERDEKCEKLKKELLDLKKEIQEIEANRKSAKEFEIKYNKLESLYSAEKEKLAQERLKSKAELSALRKNSEDTLRDLEKLRNTYARKEKTWTEEKDKFEDEIMMLRKQLKPEMKGSSINGQEYITKPVISEASKTNRHENDITSSTEHKIQITELERKIKSQTNEIERLKLEKEELQNEMITAQQKWTKDKEDLLHKARQEEKIRNVELDALQQKFSSRMRIMEDTNKSLNSQLVQARRERDYHREALHTYERKVADELQSNDRIVKRQNDVAQKCTSMAKQISELKEEVAKLSNDLKLEKEAHEADKTLWAVERSHIKPIKSDGSISDKENNAKQITERALKAAEIVQKQYSEYQKFSAKEIDKLNTRIKELTNLGNTRQRDYERKIKNLTEQIKVLEISQRNLIEARDLQVGAKEMLETEFERFQEALNLHEVQRLTRKYKISSIIEQLQVIFDVTRKSHRLESDTADILKAMISQLKKIREEDSQSHINGHEASKLRIGANGIDERLGPLGSESDAVSQTPSDNTSQYSVQCIKHYSYNTLPTSSNRIAINIPVTESSSAIDIRQLENIHRSQSPAKKITPFPDPPPSFILTDGHSQTSLPVDGEDSNFKHSRSAGNGASLLHKVRRVDLARGSQPSVRLMAQAFETMQTNTSKESTTKRSLFSIRKSRSVENSETGKGIGSFTKNVLTPGAPSPVAATVLGRNTSLSEIEQLMGSQSPYGNVPRSGRNPFKNMGTKLVERVRRSLSRSSSKKSREKSIESLQEGVITNGSDNDKTKTSESKGSDTVVKQDGEGKSAIKSKVKKKGKKIFTTTSNDTSTIEASSALQSKA